MPSSKAGGVQLSVAWQWKAALLSRPVDLTALVALSRTQPHEFIEEDLPHKIVSKLLNNASEAISNKDTKLDALTILANLAACGSEKGKLLVRDCLFGITHFFEEYCREQEAVGVGGRHGEALSGGEQPDLHKAMLLLLARVYDYGLKTEDVLELTSDDRLLALECVLGLLEDGETYSLELKQRARPTEGQLASWEHEYVTHRHEKPLVLQMCRLLRGFSHPTSYFSSSCEGDSSLTLHSVGAFSDEINSLQDLAMRSALIEKLAYSLQSCLGGAAPLEAQDHLAVSAVNQFVQNLYLFGSASNAMYRHHLLSDTGLVTTLLLPYLNTVVRDLQQQQQQSKQDAPSPSCPLLQGLTSSLRTLAIACFRAPPQRPVLVLLRRSNPTPPLLHLPGGFIPRHPALLALLFLLNINLGALDLVVSPERDNSALDAFQAQALRHELSLVYRTLGPEAQHRVLRSVMHAGSLPVSRDTPSYRAAMAILTLREAGPALMQQPQPLQQQQQQTDPPYAEEEDSIREARAEAKEEARHRLMQAARHHHHQHQDDKKEGEEEEEGEGEDRGPSEACGSTCGGYRLLGELPPLDRRREQAEEGAVAESEAAEQQEGGEEEEEVEGARLQLPAKDGKPRNSEVPPAKPPGKSHAPSEFCCAINGHLMSDPVRSPYGHVFERATIELWLRTRGQVCPLTHEPLTLQDLRPDAELRSRIQRLHIERIANSCQPVSLEGDDLYDF